MIHELSCVVHVHSRYSDGTATVEEIIAAARATAADAVLLTDHDTLGARCDGLEGWHDGVLLVVGHEVSPRGGHLLAFGLDEVVPHEGRTEADACREVARRGGLSIAAHPFSEGSRMSRRIGRPHPWPALDDPACGALELWSLTTDLAESWASPRAAMRALRRPESALDGPPERHLRRWDELCEQRAVVAIGGLDAHQPGVRLRGRVRSIMPHDRWFGFLRTHVLLDAPPSGDRARDVTALLDAIRRGRCHLARADLGDPTGFRFIARRAGGEVRMGATAPAGEWTLTASAPKDADLRLLRAGEEVARADGRELTCEAREPGAYRVEAWLDTADGPRRWIVSNPVYLRRED